MNDTKTNDIKTVRLVNTDTNVALPDRRYDSYLKEYIEFNPDAFVSEQYADELMKSYSCFKKAGKEDIIDKSKYKIREDYKKAEVSSVFEKLSPNQREELVKIAEGMLAGDKKQVDESNQVQTAVETNELPSSYELYSDGQLKAEAKRLGIKAWHLLSRENLIKSIEEFGKTDNSEPDKEDSQ